MTTLIVTGTPAVDQDEARGRYLQGVLPILITAGGKPVKRLRVTNTITGENGTAIALVMDFENAEAITDVFASDDYQALVADRDKAFSKLEILVTEDLS